MYIFSCHRDKEVIEDNFISLLSRNLSVSHLFADDVLVFGKANVHTLKALNRSLPAIASSCSLSMNSNKSSICFYRNTKDIPSLCCPVNIQPGTFPITYFGIPLIDSNLRSANFSLLLDRIYAWLASWKSKFLSYEGRLQLMRSSINSLLVYWLRAIAIPKCILKKINSLTTNFFFNGNDQNKIHMIAWNNTTLPTSKGGIGLLNVHDFNTIFKIKKIWKSLKQSSLFIKWCSMKHISLW